MNDDELIARLRAAGSHTSAGLDLQGIAHRVVLRRRGRMMVLVVASVLLMVLPMGLARLTRGEPTIVVPGATLECPPTLAQGVPPSDLPGFDPRQELIPTQTPSDVVICRYPTLRRGSFPPDLSDVSGSLRPIETPGPSVVNAPDRWGLVGEHYVTDGSRQLVAGADRLVTKLRSLYSGLPTSTSCKAIIVDHQYLLRLRYGNGVVWVNVRSIGCALLATNEGELGQVAFQDQGVALQADLDVAFSTGTWPLRGMCPLGTRDSSSAHTVPAIPTVAEASRQLVPSEVPESAVVCRYDGVTRGTRGSMLFVPLTGEVTVVSGLGQIVGELARAAPVNRANRSICTLKSGRGSAYLLRLGYPSGIVWVAAFSDPNRCSGATNGVVATREYVVDLLQRAYVSGAPVKNTP